MKNLDYFLSEYLRNRPLFLAVLRAKEAYLYKEYLPFKRPVLDFGCGDGYFAKIAFAKNFQFSKSPASAGSRKQRDNFQYKGQIIDVGLDVEESRINEVQRQGIYKKIVIYDGKVIPFKNASFSTVASNSVLEHVDDLNMAVSEISRILKPKGKFLTTVMTSKWEDYLWGAKIFGKAYKNYIRKKQVHINLLSRDEWDRKFTKAGFKIIKTVGHLDEFSSGLIDFLHYVSMPSLITYKLTGKWVIFPKFADIIYPRKLLINLTKKNTSPDKSGALFYELEKK